MSESSPDRFARASTQDTEVPITLTSVKSEIRVLRAVKVVHTVVWVLFVGCIVAIPMLAWRGCFGLAALFIGIVAAECLVIVFNGWRCPLTPIAARYTDDRRDNFDIYLPKWLARHNKTIFGTLYAIGALFTLVRWLKGVR